MLLGNFLSESPPLIHKKKKQPRKQARKIGQGIFLFVAIQANGGASPIKIIYLRYGLLLDLYVLMLIMREAVLSQ